MSNYSEEHTDSGSSQTDARPLWTSDSQTEAASLDVPVASQISGSAGDSSPQQSLSRAADDLLVEAIRTLLGRNSRPFAAGVYGLMRQLEPTFTFALAGFPSFRALLQDAQERGVITMVAAPKGSDVVVSEAGGRRVGPRATAATLRKDLWDAFVDWNPQANYAFRPASNEVVTLPAGDAGDEHAIRIPSASREDQLVWMRELMESETNEAVKAELAAALADEQPTRAFARVLRERAPVARRWKRLLRTRIVSRASEWAARQNLSDGVLLPAVTTSVPDKLSKSARSANEDAAARDRILAILADLPLSELLQLRIPLEYALRR